MASKRKTVKVYDLIQWINAGLANEHRTVGQRQTLCTVADHVLMSSGNYEGFSYLSEDEVPEGHLPGIRKAHFDPHATIDAMTGRYSDGRFTNVDYTRRAYFCQK